MGGKRPFPSAGIGKHGMGWLGKDLQAPPVLLDAPGQGGPGLEQPTQGDGGPIEPDGLSHIIPTWNAAFPHPSSCFRPSA